MDFFFVTVGPESMPLSEDKKEVIKRKIALHKAQSSRYPKPGCRASQKRGRNSPPENRLVQTQIEDYIVNLATDIDER